MVGVSEGHFRRRVKEGDDRRIQDVQKGRSDRHAIFSGCLFLFLFAKKKGGKSESSNFFCSWSIWRRQIPIDSQKSVRSVLTVLCKIQPLSCSQFAKKGKRESLHLLSHLGPPPLVPLLLFFSNVGTFPSYFRSSFLPLFPTG